MTPWRPMVSGDPSHAGPLRVVLFSGGRGSSALAAPLLADPRIALTLAINGYDDGASTGEVRRFLGDALGPSDFRKNAARVARARASAPAPLVDLLDLRLPSAATEADLARLLAHLQASAPAIGDGAAPAFWQEAATLASAVPAAPRAAIVETLERFETERRSTGRAFDFGGCAVGNLVFAGLFLLKHRRFNEAVDAYGGVLGVPEGLVENVTDGTNAFLVGIDRDGRLLGSEAEIVDARRSNHVADIMLLGDRLQAADLAAFDAVAAGERAAWLASRARPVALNPRLAARIATADLLVYAPGTQHSSLFPSYLTEGLGEAIAANVRAVKLLVTNLQPDAEIRDRSAVDIVDRALYYLTRHVRAAIPAPCLITHSLINRPTTGEAATPYVAPGALDRIEDPRLVLVSNFEAGASGRHDAAKVLGPFLDVLLERRRRPRAALLLQGTSAANKIVQTALELTRAGAAQVPVDLVVFHTCRDAALARIAGRLPFRIEPLVDADAGRAFVAAAHGLEADYVGLLDSSGMYNGEDLVGLLAQLPLGRPAAVWGSRRLSVRDVHESYRLRYRHHLLLGCASYLGSHLLSLMYLVCYGRYVSDTLSEARFVRTEYLTSAPLMLQDRQFNHALLAGVLGDRAELRELPVRFLPLSPARARRTGIADGLSALGTIVRLRLRRRHRRAQERSPANQVADLAGRPL